MALSGQDQKLILLEEKIGELENVMALQRVAKDQMGIGGDDSWGARTHEEYLLETDKKMEFSFVFKGL